MTATARLLQKPCVPFVPSSSRAARLPAGLGREKRPVVVVKAAVASPQSVKAWEDPRVNLVSLLANAITTGKAMKLLPLRPNSWKLQMVLEKALIDCRFFTMFAVLGSLLGSILCFIEGCIFIVQSYIHCFHNMLSHKSDHGHVVNLLIEAIDMFLVGTAMLVFGMGLYVTYVRSKSTDGKESWLPRSNLFGLFNLKTLPPWVKMQTVSQTKSKVGHAVMMMLQVGVLEKFKSVPLVTGLDLACFAGAVLFSSAGIFVLSKLSVADSRL